MLTCYRWRNWDAGSSRVCSRSRDRNGRAWSLTWYTLKSSFVSGSPLTLPLRCHACHLDPRGQGRPSGEGWTRLHAPPPVALISFPCGSNHLRLRTTQLEKSYGLFQILKFEDFFTPPWSPSEEVMESIVNVKIRKTWGQIPAPPLLAVWLKANPLTSQRLSVLVCRMEIKVTTLCGCQPASLVRVGFHLGLHSKCISEVPGTVAWAVSCQPA